jgi:hypothetical protein
MPITVASDKKIGSQPLLTMCCPLRCTETSSKLVSPAAKNPPAVMFSQYALVK